MLLSEDVDTADEDANNSCKKKTFSFVIQIDSPAEVFLLFFFIRFSLYFGICFWFILHRSRILYFLFLYLLIHSIFCVFIFLSFESQTNSTVVLVSLGSKKELRTLEVCGSSPKQRASIAATSSFSMDVSMLNDSDASGAATSQSIQHQLSLDQTCSSSKTSVALTTPITVTTEVTEVIDIVAEPLDKILDNKLVREKRIEFERKIESMRKKHDKEKIRVTSQRSGDLTDGIRKSKFYMNNKLVKRLSNKNM